MKYINWIIVLLLFSSCFKQERKCEDFRNGKFSFTTIINGEEKTTTFVRNEEIEIDFFEGKTDSSTIQWINDCEYIVKKMSPRNMAEKKAIHIKILSTSTNSYTFEYGEVGKSNKQKGTALKID